MNILVQNISMYLKMRLFSQDYFGLFWPFAYDVLFCTHIEPFWTNNKKRLPIFGKQWKFKYIRYHRYWTNEYPNIFVSINRWQMNIRIYLPWKFFTNIWTNEYIHLNIFKYIRISEYLSHTATFLHTYICTYLHLYIPTFQHSYIPTFLNSKIPIFLHSYIYMHTFIHY